MFKKLIQKQLENKVRKYLKKHKPTLVLIVGSVGKTSTKLAIATVLGEKYRVRADRGNRNTEMSVPTAIMGVDYPTEVRSVRQWLAVLQAMNLRIKQPRDVDVIVQEIGTDKPGDIASFGRYLHAEIAVVTAVSEEHMEFFPSIDDVAKEELGVTKFARLTVINRDDVDVKYADIVDVDMIDTYGLGEKAEYRLSVEPSDPLQGRLGHISTPEWGELPVSLQLVGDHSLKAAAAAACVGAKLGLDSEQVSVGVSKISPVSGRMQLLRGVNGSTVIDDSYNSSPLAAIRAIETLSSVEAEQRIAVMGSMNELGSSSADAHTRVGAAFEGAGVEYVVTVGQDAKQYLAPSAVKAGCQVRSFDSPYDAGSFVHNVLKKGAVVLVKGSQNRVFTEEAIKEILHSTSDEKKLVRQSAEWLAIKHEQFEKIK